MSLLPSKPDAEPSEDAGPRVIGVDSEDADDVLAALSSGTARELLSVLHEEPAPPSELADEVDTSLQNTQYHLEKLEAAGAIEVVDTAYSEKGREMDVYAPADQPLVIFAGDEEKGSTLRSALSRLLGSVGVLALASLAVQALVARDQAPAGDGGVTEPAGGDGGAPAGGAVDTPTDESVAPQVAETTETAVETATPTATETVRQTTEAVQTGADAVGQAAGLPPGLLFFAGGLVALGVVAVALALRS